MNFKCQKSLLESAMKKKETGQLPTADESMAYKAHFGISWHDLKSVSQPTSKSLIDEVVNFVDGKIIESVNYKRELIPDVEKVESGNLRYTDYKVKNKTVITIIVEE
ncbi:hypothetical protein [Bacillus sp. XF8]|uniref:hypothetical protein n=1 Tax=Bacillus sp. XF8 TaxID=2819289 RepID=UPI001AA09F49|nr:hypothetical protein [Bacillus sp. XF8]MBO1583133.1 hypothetical protein [Bacillus sp. XF8]